MYKTLKKEEAEELASFLAKYQYKSEVAKKYFLMLKKKNYTPKKGIRSKLGFIPPEDILQSDTHKLVVKYNKHLIDITRGKATLWKLQILSETAKVPLMPKRNIKGTLLEVLDVGIKSLTFP